MHDSVLPIMPNVILFRIVVQLKRKTLYYQAVIVVNVYVVISK